MLTLHQPQAVLSPAVTSFLTATHCVWAGKTYNDLHVCLASYRDLTGHLDSFLSVK